MTSFVSHPAFEAESQANRTKIINQPKQAPIEENLVDTTNTGVSTVRFPGDDGSTMLGFDNISVDGKMIADATGTVTGHMEMTNDEDASGADWKQVMGQDDINGGTVNQFSVSNATLLFAISFNTANFKRWRWVFDYAVSGTNTSIAKARRS
jgi:hypothetical protein